MKGKIERYLLNNAQTLSALSNCCRRQVGALIVTPKGIILSSAYNGTAPGGPRRCGGYDTCERERLKIKSGERLEIGCSHAEASAIGHAAARGVAISGAWIVITCEPCRSCARLIVAAGIVRAIIYSGVYSDEGGALYLEEYGVKVERRDPKQSRITGGFIELVVIDDTGHAEDAKGCAKDEAEGEAP